MDKAEFDAYNQTWRDDYRGFFQMASRNAGQLTMLQRDIVHQRALLCFADKHSDKAVTALRALVSIIPHMMLPWRNLVINQVAALIEDTTLDQMSALSAACLQALANYPGELSQEIIEKISYVKVPTKRAWFLISDSVTAKLVERDMSESKRLYAKKFSDFDDTWPDPKAEFFAYVCHHIDTLTGRQREISVARVRQAILKPDTRLAVDAMMAYVFLVTKMDVGLTDRRDAFHFLILAAKEWTISAAWAAVPHTLLLLKGRFTSEEQALIRTYARYSMLTDEPHRIKIQEEKIRAYEQATHRNTGSGTAPAGTGRQRTRNPKSG